MCKEDQVRSILQMPLCHKLKVFIGIKFLILKTRKIKSPEYLAWQLGHEVAG